MERVSFQHLRYLQALVEERQVTRAAQRMGVGQPAMSTALSGLRSVFRDELLVKTCHGMAPTPRALELVKQVREINHMLEGRGASSERFDPMTSEARWRIVCSDGVSRVLLPALLAAAGRRAPRMHFTVLPGDAQRMVEALREGEIDLALGIVDTVSDDLRHSPLYPIKLVCIARAGHPGIGDGLTLQQFITHKHVCCGTSPVARSLLEAVVDDELGKLGCSRICTLLVSSPTLLPEIVAESDLLAIVPEHLATAAHRAHALRVLPLPLEVAPVQLGMVWHERVNDAPAHGWLRQLLIEVAQAAWPGAAGRVADRVAGEALEAGSVS